MQNRNSERDRAVESSEATQQRRKPPEKSIRSRVAVFAESAANIRARIKSAWGEGSAGALARAIIVISGLLAATTPAAAQTGTGGGAGGSLGVLLIIGLGGLIALRRFTDIRPIQAVASRVPELDANALLLGAAAIGLAVLLGSGSIESRVPLVIGLVGVGSYALMRETGIYSPLLFAMLMAVEAIIGLSALGEPVIGAIANSNTGPVALIVFGVLAWRALSIYRENTDEPEQRAVRIVRGER